MVSHQCCISIHSPFIEFLGSRASILSTGFALYKYYTYSPSVLGDSNNGARGTGSTIEMSDTTGYLLRRKFLKPGFIATFVFASKCLICFVGLFVGAWAGRVDAMTPSVEVMTF